MVKPVEGFLRRFGDTLDLPEDIVLDLPKVTVIGNVEALIENHRGLLEYSSSRMRVRGKHGFMVITGQKLRIRVLYKEEIRVRGVFSNIAYLEE